jgi:hypothetical protein
MTLLRCLCATQSKTCQISGEFLKGAKDDFCSASWDRITPLFSGLFHVAEDVDMD